jgi:hypothetical protein
MEIYVGFRVLSVTLVNLQQNQNASNNILRVPKKFQENPSIGICSDTSGRTDGMSLIIFLHLEKAQRRMGQ